MKLERPMKETKMLKKQKALIRKACFADSEKLRNNEYYDVQEIFDDLHQKAKRKQNFYNLYDIITSKDNILLAYRNIKNNKGSTTQGIDGKTIDYYKEMNTDEFIEYFQNKLSNYYSQAVRRVEIPKPDGRTRPLGIPCIDDRIIQQCIKNELPNL